MWDIFISHATEDKESFVRPLALRAYGLRVWYDEFTLSLGETLSESIDRGLANSCFGLVVLSPHFIRKNWTRRELRGLIERDVHEEEVILPIWHNVKREDVSAFSPPLADVIALDISTLNDTEGGSKESPQLFCPACVRDTRTVRDGWSCC